MVSVTAKMNRIPNYEPHALAAYWPMASDAEYKELVENIRKVGLKEKITLFEDKILDGRNRYYACRDAGVKPEFEKLPAGEDPVAFVMAKNHHRRNLSESQRAMIGAKILAEHQRPWTNLSTDRLPKGAKHWNGELSDQPENDGERTNLSKDSSRKREQIGNSLGVSGTMIQNADAVLKKGAPEIQKAVINGDVKVSAAAAIVRAVPDQQEQVAILNEGPAAVREKAAEVRKKKAKPEPDPVQPVAPPIQQIEALLQRVDPVDALSLVLDRCDDIEAVLKLLKEKMPLLICEIESQVTLAEAPAVTVEQETKQPIDAVAEAYEVATKDEREAIYTTVTDLWLLESGSKKRTVFRKPSIEEVKEYCKERGKGMDAEKFYDYFAAQGWKLSNGNQMKDWQAAVRTWEKNQGGNAVHLRRDTPFSPSNSGPLPPAEERPLRPNPKLAAMFAKIKPVEFAEQ